MEELKKLDFREKTFTANGVEYYIADQLSSERFYRMQSLEFDLRYGVNHAKMYQDMHLLYEMLNEQKFADCAVMVYNWMQSIQEFDERKQPILEYCALFLNRKGEDLREWSQEIVDAKIEDWKQEGIDFNSFFVLALNIGNNLKEDYLRIIQDISAPQTV